MPRLQVNLSFTAEAYELVTAAAEAQGLTVTQFARAAIMDAAEPMPEGQEVEALEFPAWLVSMLIFFRLGQRNDPGPG